MSFKMRCQSEGEIEMTGGGERGRGSDPDPRHGQQLVPTFHTSNTLLDYVRDASHSVICTVAYNTSKTDVELWSYGMGWDGKPSGGKYKAPLWC